MNPTELNTVLPDSVNAILWIAVSAMATTLGVVAKLAWNSRGEEIKSLREQLEAQNLQMKAFAVDNQETLKKLVELLDSKTPISK